MVRLNAPAAGSLSREDDVEPLELVVIRRKADDRRDLAALAIDQPGGEAVAVKRRLAARVEQQVGLAEVVEGWAGCGVLPVAGSRLAGQPLLSRGLVEYPQGVAGKGLIARVACLDADAQVVAVKGEGGLLGERERIRSCHGSGYGRAGGCGNNLGRRRLRRRRGQVAARATASTGPSVRTTSAATQAGWPLTQQTCHQSLAGVRPTISRRVPSSTWSSTGNSVPGPLRAFTRGILTTIAGLGTGRSGGGRRRWDIGGYCDGVERSLFVDQLAENPHRLSVDAAHLPPVAGVVFADDGELGAGGKLGHLIVD